LKVSKKEDFIKDYVDQMYKDFESNFEDVRKTNEDMRKEANRQIEYARRKNFWCRRRNKKIWTPVIEELEGQVSELESELDAVS